MTNAPKKHRQKRQEPQEQAPPQAPPDPAAPELREPPPPVRGESEHVKDVLLRAFEGVQRAAKSRRAIVGLPTGLTRLDEMTAGLRGGDLIVVGGRPGAGKTAFALNMAVAACSQVGVPVMLFSLEARRQDLVQRILCSEAKVDNARLRTGMLSREDWARLAGAAGPLTEMPLYIEDSLTSLPQIEREIWRVQGGQRRGLVVIDYVQLMTSGAKHQSREEEVAEISRRLKALSKELDVPIIVLSQLNRGLESRPGMEKRPRLSDLRDSGALEDDADLVLFVYRPEMYAREEERPMLRGLAEVIAAKQRTGPTGIVRCRFFHEFSRFENLAEGEFEDFDGGD